MSLAPNTENYTLGKGRLFLAPYDSNDVLQAERALGNAPNFTYSITVDSLDHYSSMAGLRAKDKSVVTEVTPNLNFTLDELSTENLNLLFFGSSESVSQTAGEDTGQVISSPEKGRWYDLGKRSVGATYLPHGTVTGGPFEVGETITGDTSTATANVVYVGSGYVLIDQVSGGPFDAAETITGGTSTATATTSAAESFSATMLGAVTDGSATQYVKGTDYTFDSVSGRIFIKEDSTISGDITVFFAYDATTYTVIKGLSSTSVEGQLRFISDNPEGPQMEMVAWKVKLTPDGDTAFIGDDWAQMSFVGEVLKDESGHPSNPYMQLIM